MRIVKSISFKLKRQPPRRRIEHPEVMADFPCSLIWRDHYHRLYSKRAYRTPREGQR